MKNKLQKKQIDGIIQQLEVVEQKATERYGKALELLLKDVAWLRKQIFSLVKTLEKDNQLENYQVMSSEERKKLIALASLEKIIHLSCDINEDAEWFVRAHFYPNFYEPIIRGYSPLLEMGKFETEPTIYLLKAVIQEMIERCPEPLLSENMFLTASEYFASFIPDMLPYVVEEVEPPLDLQTTKDLIYDNSAVPYVFDINFMLRQNRGILYEDEE